MVNLIIKNNVAENCKVFNERSSQRLLKIQKELNAMQKEQSFKIHGRMMREIEKLSSCYVVLIKKVSYNKLEFARHQRHLSEKIIWQSE